MLPSGRMQEKLRTLPATFGGASNVRVTVICLSPPLVIPVGTTASTVSIRPVVQTVRSELIYKFNWDSEVVVAKH
jgi:hypothetical protein